MPIPGTNIPWPWEGTGPNQLPALGGTAGQTGGTGYDPSQPIGGGGAPPPPAAAGTAAGPSSASLATLQSLITQHGGVIGQPAPVTYKDAITGQPKADPSGAVTYTFADGSTAVVGGQGELGPVTPPPSQTAVQQQQAAGVIQVGNSTYVRNPTPEDGRGTWILSPESAGTQQLANAKTVADTQLTQAQAQNQQVTAALAADPTNVALQRQKQAADVALTQAQTQSQAINNQVAQGNLAISQGNLAIAQAKAPADIGLTQAQTAVQQQNAATAAATLPYNIGLTQAQTAVQQQNAATAAATLPYNIALTQAQTAAQQANAANVMRQAATPTVWQTGVQQPKVTYWDPTTQSVQSITNPSYQPTDPAHMVTQLQQQAQQQQQALQQQVTQGTLTADQASAQFDQWWNTNVEPQKTQIAQAQAQQQQALQLQQAQIQQSQVATGMLPANLALTASDQAQRNAISMLPYTAGAGYGQALSQAVGGIGSGKFPSINPQAIASAATYSLPNLQEIGRQGAAAALAHISPTAQAMLSQPAPPAQPPVANLPSLAGLLNQGGYTFGAPAGAAPATAAPAAPAAPTAGVDWNALLQRQAADAAAQQIQAQAWPAGQGTDLTSLLNAYNPAAYTPAA